MTHKTGQCQLGRIYVNLFNFNLIQPATSNLFRNSRRVAIWDKQDMVKHRQVLRTQEKSRSFIEERRKLGEVVLNKSSLKENESSKWWRLLIGCGQRQRAVHEGFPFMASQLHFEWGFLYSFSHMQTPQQGPHRLQVQRRLHLSQ